MSFTILVIGHDATTRTLAQNALMSCGYNVYLAENGQQGLVMLQKYAVDLLLQDLSQVPAEGLHVCTVVNQFSEQKKPILVVITPDQSDITQDGDALIQELCRLGVEEFLSKPIHPTILCHRVRVLHQNREQRKKGLYETNRLQAILETTVDGIITIDVHGLILSFNNSAERIFGYTATDVIGTNVARLMPEPYASRHDDYLRHYQQTGQRKIIGTGREVLGKKQDGTLFPLFVAVSATTLDQEVIFTGILRDLSHTKAAAAELQRLVGVVEESSNMIALTDTNGVIEYVNQAFLDATGYTKQEVVGQNTRILNSGMQSPSVYEKLWKSIRAGKKWRGEFHNRRKDGSFYWAEATISPIFREDGVISHYSATSKDVTLRKMAEAQVRWTRESQQVSNALLQLAVSSLPLEEQLQHALQRILEISWLSAHPVGAVLLLGEENTLRMQASIASASTTQKACVTTTNNQDCACRRAIHSRLVVFSAPSDTNLCSLVGSQYSVPLVFGERVFGVLSLALRADHAWQVAEETWLLTVGQTLGNMIEHKQTEMAIRTARAMAESANKAKSNFLANMSHEIRTPMNAIIGLSHLCLGTALSEKQRDYVEKIYRAAYSLLGIINDILDFSKVEAGKLTMETVAFGLADVLDNLGNLLATKVQEKSLALVFASDPNIPVCLMGDPLRLGQILLNLVGNAVKFTDVGSVTVQTALLEETTEGVVLQFWIRDSGIGMNDEQIARLFSPFTQADDSTTRKYGGTGLGLVIAKRLITLMGGTIRVESVLGQGSTFIFTVVVGRGQADQTIPTKRVERAQWAIAPLVHLRGAHILLVEDNEVNQQVAQELLESAGLQVSIANNGQEGVEMADPDRFAAILMDMQMPVMDGYQASQKLRGMPAYDHLPIIAMTADATKEDRERCFAAGVDDYVSKPIDPTHLFATLSKWVRPTLRSDTPFLPPAIALQTEPSVAFSPPPEKGEAITMELSGINLRAGLLHTGGDWRRYRDLLRRFGDNQRDVVARIQQALAVADQETGVRLAHTLKGISGTIGATAVQQAAQALEMVIKNDMTTAEISLQQVAQVLAEVLSGLANLEEDAPFSPPPTVTPQNPLDWHAVKKIVAQLVLYLEEDDADAVTALAQLHQMLTGSAWAVTLEQIRQKMAMYDFATARELLTKWVDSLPLTLHGE